MTLIRTSVNLPNVPSQDREACTPVCMSVSAIVADARATAEEIVEFMVAGNLVLWMMEDTVSESDMIEC